MALRSLAQSFSFQVVEQDYWWLQWCNLVAHLLIVYCENLTQQWKCAVRCEVCKMKQGLQCLHFLLFCIVLWKCTLLFFCPLLFLSSMYFILAWNKPSKLKGDVCHLYSQLNSSITEPVLYACNITWFWEEGSKCGLAWPGQGGWELPSQSLSWV